jgi:hypothetical protein
MKRIIVETPRPCSHTVLAGGMHPISVECPASLILRGLEGDRKACCPACHAEEGER